MAFVYILRCADGTLYVGLTSDVDCRLERHRNGTAARYTASRLPVDLVFREEHSTLKTAVARERQIKRWTHAKKEALIAGDADALKALSRSRHVS